MFKDAILAAKKNEEGTTLRITIQPSDQPESLGIKQFYIFHSDNINNIYMLKT